MNRSLNLPLPKLAWRGRELAVPSRERRALTRRASLGCASTLRAMCWWPALFPLALAQNSSGATLAHVQNLTAPGVNGVLRWWCDEQGHAAEPLCVRHEITLQISLAHGTERWQLQQRRHRLAGTSAAAELAGAIAAYCNDSATTQLQRASGVCKRASAAAEPHVPMMEQLCASPRAPRARTMSGGHERAGVPLCCAGWRCTTGGACRAGTTRA